jgi:hypothetical protein
VQNLHSASKNSHPRAWRPLPSVNSEVSEIIIAFSPCRSCGRSVGPNLGSTKILSRRFGLPCSQQRDYFAA